jgi:hypothetical protein
LYILTVDFLTFGVMLKRHKILLLKYMALSGTIQSRSPKLSRFEKKPIPLSFHQKPVPIVIVAKKKRFEMGGVIAKPYNVVQELSI